MFRDDREALLLRAEALEAELGRERGDRQALGQRQKLLEDELAALRRELRRVQGRGERPASSTAPLLFAVLAVVMLAAGVAGVFTLRASAPAPAQVTVPIPLPPPQPPTPAPVTLLPATAPATVEAPVEPLPRMQPTRYEVHLQFTASRDAVTACALGTTGTAAARTVIDGRTGRVTSVTIVGPPFAGTRAGECMSRALRRMSFEPFGNPSLTVTYPFIIR